MQKILDIKGADFPKGQSAAVNLPVGGLFQEFQGIDPFEVAGVAKASLAGTSFNVNYASKYLTSWNNGTTSYVYSLGDTTLTQLLSDSPYTATDETTQIATMVQALGSITWKGYYIYAYKPSLGANPLIHSNSLPVASGNDVFICGNLYSLLDDIPLCVGADGNLYAGDYFQIHTITSATGSTGNSTRPQIDPDMVVRAIVNDGKYLVILADNNAVALSQVKTGNYHGRIYFWDMVKTDGNGRIVPDAMYDVTDPYITAATFLENGVYFFGRNGLYVCNAGTSPKLIRPFTGTGALSKGIPKKSSQLVASKGSLFWIDGGTDSSLQGYLYAYGNPTTGQTKVFYTPYITEIAVQDSLLCVGDQFWLGNRSPHIWVLNTGSTRGSSALWSINQTMENPFRYDLTKVVLETPLATGQTVQVHAFSTHGTVTLSNETKSYSTTNAKQQLLFRKAPSGGSEKDIFEDFSILVNTTGGVTIDRVTSYGTPLDDMNETI